MALHIDNENLNANEIENATNTVSNVLIRAAEKSFRRVKTSSQHKKKGKTYAKHFDLDCKKLLREVKHMSRKVSRDPKNLNLRKSYYSNKKLLHRLVKQKLALEKENIAKTLSSQSDPKEFWKTIEKLRQCTHGKKQKIMSSQLKIG